MDPVYGDPPDDPETSMTRPRQSPGDDSVDSVTLNPVPSSEDNESIALLRQIFPEESTDALRRIHRQRLGRKSLERTVHEKKSLFDAASPSSHGTTATNTTASPTTPSPLRRRNLENYDALLPEDFLRLPSDIAVRRYDPTLDRFRYELVADLDRRIKEKLSFTTLTRQQHPLLQPGVQYPAAVHTRVIFRHSIVGLGMTLVEQHGQVRVYATLDYQGKEWNWTPSVHGAKVGGGTGPAMDVGLAPGDIVLGLNGALFTESQRLDRSLLRHAVETIRTAPDPVVIHFAKYHRTTNSNGTNHTRDNQNHIPFSPHSLSFWPPAYDLATTPSLLDTTLHDVTIDENPSQEEISFAPMTFHSTPLHGDTVSEPRTHKFIQTLQAAGLFDSHKLYAQTEELYRQYTERTRQWEALSCFRVQAHPDEDLFVPLMGIRRALCVRIVNSFAMTAGNVSTPVDRKVSTPRTPYSKGVETMAYTIWVYDTQSGREFYAPVRTFADFCDLRAAVVALQSNLRQIDFPKRKSPLFGSPVRETPSEKERKTRQLESFLRSLCAILYQGTLHASIAEIAIHVQSFLGCDNVDFDTVPIHAVNDDTLAHHATRNRLKRSLQLYTFRLFLLPPLAEKVTSFVDHVRSREPFLAQELEEMEARGSDRLKEQAFQDLQQVKSFLDYLQDLILDGCTDDFVSIARREEYDAIHAIWRGNQGEVYWDRLIREAVREQVEIEVYVPLRSLLSRWLVNGWRHEDMEAHYKIRELRKRPQQFFRLPSWRSADDWLAASSILKEGVGMSTLPCVKLRAIVDAAQEISKIFEAQRASMAQNVDASPRNKKTAAATAAPSEATHLGADQFLPIFIFCVVQAEIDRPCALCVLLRSLCDRINKIGEIGYYLASFEAAVTHIQEIDLASEQGEQMRSFISVNLDSN